MRSESSSMSFIYALKNTRNAHCALNILRNSLNNELTLRFLMKYLTDASGGVHDLSNSVLDELLLIIIENMQFFCYIDIVDFIKLIIGDIKRTAYNKTQAILALQKWISYVCDIHENNAHRQAHLSNGVNFLQEYQNSEPSRVPTTIANIPVHIVNKNMVTLNVIINSINFISACIF